MIHPLFDILGMHWNRTAMRPIVPTTPPSNGSQAKTRVSSVASAWCDFSVHFALIVLFVEKNP